MSEKARKVLTAVLFAMLFIGAALSARQLHSYGAAKDAYDQAQQMAFHTQPASTQTTQPEETAEPEEAELDELLEGEMPHVELSRDTLERLDALIGEAAEEAAEEEVPGEAEETAEEPAPQLGDTIRMDEIIREVRKETAEETAEDPAVSEDATIRIEIPEDGDILELENAVDTEEIRQMVEEEEPAPAPVIEFNPRLKLRELKRKLVAGPEKRYYELSEMGTARVQFAAFVALLITVGCGAVATMYAMDLIPESRLRLVIFTQILTMLLAALLGCHQMMDAWASCSGAALP